MLISGSLPDALLETRELPRQAVVDLGGLVQLNGVADDEFQAIFDEAQAAFGGGFAHVYVQRFADLIVLPLNGFAIFAEDGPQSV